MDELAKLRAKHENIKIAEMLKKILNDIPLRRLVKLKEIASAIIYIASEIGGYVNSQTIIVDGGNNKSALNSLDWDVFFEHIYMYENNT